MTKGKVLVLKTITNNKKVLKNFLTVYKFHLVIFVISFLIFANFNFDPDLGWHLKIGEHFLKTGEIIRADTFSWTLPGYVWGNSYFAYQILVAFLYANFGYLVTIFVFAIIGDIAVLILLPKKISFNAVLITILGTEIVASNLGVRPHTISFLFFVILLRILVSNSLWKKKYFWFWFLFFASWANFHNAYLIGLFVLGSYKAIDLIWKLASKKKVNWSDFIVNISAGLAGTFFTPFGAYLWLAILNDAFFPNMYINIAEWFSVVIIENSNILYAVSGILFIYILWKNFERIGPNLVFISCFLFMLPFIGMYFVFFWAVIFIFLGSRYLNKSYLKGDLGLFEKLPVYLGIVILISAVVFMFISGFLGVVSSGMVFKVVGYPSGAVEFMKREGINKNVFNEYNWGGYLDWAYEDLKIFIDGRMTGWHKDGRSILSEYLEIKKGNCDVASRYQIESLLVYKGSKTNCFADFERVYEDGLAEVWVRNN